MTDPRVVIDGRPLVGMRTGIGVMTAEIAGRLALDPPPLIASHAAIRNREGIEDCRFRVDRSPLGVLWQQALLPRVVTEENGDVLWGPHGTLPTRFSTSSVLTMHDLTSITMPHRHRLRTVLSFNTFVGRSLARANRVVCVSQFVADQVIRGFNVPASRVRVVPLAADSALGPRKPGDRPALPRRIGASPYVLYVGTIEPRKGIGDLLSAWEREGAGRKLVICGGRGWRSSGLLARLERHRDVILTGFVDRATLHDLYRHADLFVYPSHDEGFGLPPLEAMAAGVPVLSTRAGAIPEVVGDAALLVSPGDPGSLSKAMKRILEDSGLRSDLVERGLARAATFSWNRAAAMMREILVDAAQEGPQGV